MKISKLRIGDRFFVDGEKWEVTNEGVGKYEGNRFGVSESGRCMDFDKSVEVEAENAEEILKRNEEEKEGGCPYCGRPFESEGKDLLCDECRELFGHMYYHEL